MIQEVIMFTVVCDNCGKDCNENQEYSCWNDKMHARDIAMESDWEISGDTHYCPLCWSHDDNDNIVIDESRKGLKKIEPNEIQSLTEQLQKANEIIDQLTKQQLTNETNR